MVWNQTSLSYLIVRNALRIDLSPVLPNILMQLPLPYSIILDPQGQGQILALSQLWAGFGLQIFEIFEIRENHPRTDPRFHLAFILHGSDMAMMCR